MTHERPRKMNTWRKVKLFSESSLIAFPGEIKTHRQ